MKSWEQLAVAEKISKQRKKERALVGKVFAGCLESWTKESRTMSKSSWGKKTWKEEKEGLTLFEYVRRALHFRLFLALKMGLPHSTKGGLLHTKRGVSF